ncbi:MAG TPA: ABC transporter ATP-binding protein [Candidatus Eisenbacteria bacterium]|nr:ABC transporter ATP-binding protein [Candidatus Eisenbacteria bacterium]
MTPAVELLDVTKTFGRLVANDRVSLSVRRGSIHALVGENGAGKTTLMKVLFGLYQPASGVIRVDGASVRFRSPWDALRRGLGMVHQHFMLVPPLTVAENITLGREPTAGLAFDRKRAEHDVEELSRRHGLRIDPRVRVENLSVGEQQRVEILKTLYRGARILILDEPTAVLTPQEVDELFAVLRGLRDQGDTVILITHKLREVMELSDRVTVLRGGRVVGECDTKDTTIGELAEMMVGRQVLLTLDKAPSKPGGPALDVQGLCVRDDRGLDAVKDVSLAVRAGEIVGVAGVEGNGQAELIEALTGLRPVSAGTVRLGARDVTRATPLERLRSGLAHVPADRLRRGILAEYDLADNLILGRQRDRPFAKGAWLDREAIQKNAVDTLAANDVRPPVPQALVRTLSGGNQQKLVVGRELSRRAGVLIAAHPTRGVDLGASEFIHRRLLAERDRGCGVLLVSSELSELLSLSDRLVVLYEGRIVFETRPADTDERSLGLYMSGQAAAHA